MGYTVQAELFSPGVDLQHALWFGIHRAYAPARRSHRVAAPDWRCARVESFERHSHSNSHPPPTRSRIKLLDRCESSSDHERTNECMAVRSQLTGVLWTLQTVPRQPAFPPYPAHIRCVLSIPTPNWASPCIYRTNTGRPICSENARNRPRNQPRQKVREISIAKAIEMEKGANGTKKSMLRLGNGGSENVMTSSRALRQAVTSHVTMACCIH